MAEPVQLEQPTGDLKAPQKTSSLFFEPSVSFDTISDPREGSQSLVIWLYKLKLQASLPRLKNKYDKFSNTTSVGKNWDFNQMHGHFMLPPPSLFFQLCAPVSRARNNGHTSDIFRAYCPNVQA